MSRILFMMPGAPLTFNYSGAASRYAQNFLTLQALGHEMHVLRFHNAGSCGAALEVENASEAAQKTRQSALSWQEVELPINGAHSRVEMLRRILFDPSLAEFPQHRFLTTAIRSRMDQIKPSLLWAEHADAAAGVWGGQFALPWIYSQHDMRYLIRFIRTRQGGLLSRWADAAGRRAEAEVVGAASAIVTGSYCEQKRLQQAGGRDVYVIPMINDALPDLDLTLSPAPDLRLIHLGALETTANRHGLMAYLTLAHVAALKQADLTLTVVGDVSGLKPPLSGLLHQPGVVCTGYVPDLTTVLRPFDISILPYTHDSGYRTKLPLLMGYAQVILATRAAVAGSLTPGLEQVCVLVERVEDFPVKIAWLAANPNERQRLGLAARAFAAEHFSADAVRPRYANLLDRLLGG